MRFRDGKVIAWTFLPALMAWLAWAEEQQKCPT